LEAKAVPVNIDEIRRHFRRETGKLDRWVYQGKIGDYFVDPVEAERIARWLETRNHQDILEGDFDQQFKVFNLLRMLGEISWEDWRRETRNLLLIHQGKRPVEAEDEAS
jgi:hypothetical protein